MEVGLAVACIVFVYRMSALFRVEPDAEHAATAPGVVAYRLYGALFFAATAKLEALPDQLPPATTTLVLDALKLVSIDASGLDAFENVHRALQRKHVRLVLVGLNEQPLAAMRRWGLDTLLGRENLFVDRDTAFAELVGANAQ
jgi:SulP family sulfate permease